MKRAIFLTSLKPPVFSLIDLLKKDSEKIFHFGQVESSSQVTMKSKKQTLPLALLTTGVLLMVAEYQLYTKQMKMNLDPGKRFLL